VKIQGQQFILSFLVFIRINCNSSRGIARNETDRVMFAPRLRIKCTAIEIITKPQLLMQRIFLTLFSIGVMVFPANAQRDTSSQLSIYIGPAMLSRQDLIFSPFIHKDLSPLSLGLKYEWDHTLHQFLKLDYAGFTAGVETPYDILVDGETETVFPHSFTFIGFDYGAGKWLGDNVRSPSLLGGSLNMDVQAMTYQYGRSSFFGYYATIGIGVWYKKYFHMGDRHQLSAQVEVPLVSWYARSPYLVNDDEFIENIYSHNGFTTFFAYLGDGELVTWNKLQTVNAGVDYQYELSDKWSVGASWKFAFIHASDPLPLTSVQNSFVAMIGLRM
jgi:hypothetical protein